MKHSQYIMLSPWDDPKSFFWEVPTVRDAKGNVLKTTRKPAHISSHRTAPDSMAQGIILCARKMTIDVPPLAPPS